MTDPHPLRRVLCRLDELDDPGSIGLVVETTAGPRDILVVRRGDRAWAYVNRCPHTGAPLDWMPGRFLDMDRQYIQCANHDARFDIGDGTCVAGPCAGDRLTAVPLRIVDGGVVFPGDWP